MNRDHFVGNWKQWNGKVIEQWGKLTANSSRVVAGQRGQLAGRIQKQYGTSLEKAERQLKDFFERNRGWNTSHRN